jgi:hypothetical protein
MPKSKEVPALVCGICKESTFQEHLSLEATFVGQKNTPSIGLPDID